VFPPVYLRCKYSIGAKRKSLRFEDHLSRDGRPPITRSPHVITLGPDATILNQHALILGPHARILTAHARILGTHAKIHRPEALILPADALILYPATRILSHRPLILGYRGLILSHRALILSKTWNLRQRPPLSGPSEDQPRDERNNKKGDGRDNGRHWDSQDPGPNDPRRYSPLNG